MQEDFLIKIGLVLCGIALAFPALIGAGIGIWILTLPNDWIGGTIIGLVLIGFAVYYLTITIGLAFERSIGSGLLDSDDARCGYLSLIGAIFAWWAFSSIYS